MRAAVAFLDSLQGRGIRPGLGRMQRLLAPLGHPERAYRTIIVAGTNGKGSTAATLASMLTEAGYRTGLYTSPHLVTLLERWQIDREPVDSRPFQRAVRQLQAAVRESGIVPTYFEALTLVGFLLFRDLACEVVVLEVGMGGRLDATNVTKPLLAVITSVSFDHIDYLGETLGKIATEKAGVIQKGSVAVTTNRSGEVVTPIRSRAREVGAALHLTSKECVVSGVVEKATMVFTLQTPAGTYALATPLGGAHQLDNVAAAVRGAELLRDAFPRLDARAITRGVRRTVWRGRLERALVRGKRWLIDGAHNPDGVQRLVDYLSNRPKRSRTLVFAAMNDKDVASIAARLFPLFDVIVFTRADIARGMPIEVLREIARPMTDAELLTVERPSTAFSRALKMAPPEIVVAGSLYLAGAAVSFVDRSRSRSESTTAKRKREKESARAK